MLYYKEFKGSLFKQIDEVLAYLHVFNRVRGTFERVYRIDHPDYPDVTLREAYVNALIHRDYYLEGSVLISMFDDRLEFIVIGQYNCQQFILIATQYLSVLQFNKYI